MYAKCEYEIPLGQSMAILDNPCYNNYTSSKNCLTIESVGVSHDVT